VPALKAERGVFGEVCKDRAFHERGGGDGVAKCHYSTNMEGSIDYTVGERDRKISQADR
jgi:hypothetical protein